MSDVDCMSCLVTMSRIDPRFDLCRLVDTQCRDARGVTHVVLVLQCLDTEEYHDIYASRACSPNEEISLDEVRSAPR